MAARIVYEGNARAEEGGGDLFAGLKLHFYQTVPMRLYWEGIVKANGGKVVALDVAADIKIADHARKNPPPDSISWKFVEESIKQGRLEDTEDHLAPNRGQAKPANGAKAKAAQSTARIGRTPFTKEDDAQLRAYCLKQARLGKKMRGNEIYQKFALTNLRHTAQSWRDRWIKHLSFEVLADEEREAADNEDVAERVENRVEKPKVKVKVESDAARHDKQQAIRSNSGTPIKSEEGSPTRLSDVSASPGNSPSKLRTRVVRRKNFNEADIALLLGEYNSIMQIDEEKEREAWETWESQYPAHSAQEWLDYFNKNLRGTIPVVLSSPRTSKSPSPGVSPKQPLRRSLRNSTPIDSPSAQLLRSAKAARNGMSPTDDDKRRKIPKPGLTGSPGLSDRDTPSSVPHDAFHASPPSEDEMLFNKNLLDFAENEFPNHEVNFAPIILGVQVSLYQLWKIVGSKEFGGSVEIDSEDRWSEVAETLGFGDFAQAEAGLELRDCYNELIQSLDKHLKELMASHLDDLAEAQLLQTTNGATRYQPDDNDDEVDSDDEESILPSSPPTMTSKKRPSPSQLTPNSSKKQRLDKGKGRALDLEIPSTPEELLARPRRSSANHPSPLRNATKENDTLFVEEEQEEVDLAWNQTVSPTPVRTRVRARSSRPTTATTSARHKVAVRSLPAAERPSKAPRKSSLSDSVITQRTFRKPSIDRPESSKTPHRARSSNGKADSSSADTATALDEFKERCSALGYAEDIIFKALRATSLRIGGVATNVMESIRNGGRIPDDIPGVWSERDDKDFDTWRKATKARDKHAVSKTYPRLVAKHTRDGVKARREFIRNIE